MPVYLTEPQSHIYTIICDYMRREGMPPTNREIGQAAGIHSTGLVAYYLAALEDKGVIERIPGRSRGIRLTNQSISALALRIIGVVAAGALVERYPEGEQELLDMGAYASGASYALRVKGDSMMDDHIFDGDFVVIDRDAEFNRGDIVVATRLGSTTGAGAATLKRYYRELGRIRLQPANAAYEPIVIDAEAWKREWSIQGKVVAVHRVY